MTVLVHDAGLPEPLFGERAARVVINVVRNRQAPQFVGGPYSKDITEGIEVGSDVIVLQADDADEQVRSPCCQLPVILFRSLIRAL